MPGPLHAAVVSMFQRRPELAVALLGKHCRVPSYQELRLLPTDFAQALQPAYHADAVLELLAAGRPVLAIVVEVQLARDEDKLYTWPLYVAGIRAGLRCPACLLVVTPDARVARWARREIHLGPPGCVFRPLVLGPEATPIIVEVEQALRDPDLALLSALAHARGDQGLAAGVAALVASARLDEEQSKLYADLILAALGRRAHQALERLMQHDYEYQSDFAKRYISEGMAKGRAEGKAEGMAEGKAEGMAEGKAETILVVLDARGLTVTKPARRRILGCTDLAKLDRWARRAAQVASVAELLR